MPGFPCRPRPSKHGGALPVPPRTEAAPGALPGWRWAQAERGRGSRCPMQCPPRQTVLPVKHGWRSASRKPGGHPVGRQGWESSSHFPTCLCSQQVTARDMNSIVCMFVCSEGLNSWVRGATDTEESPQARCRYNTTSPEPVRGMRAVGSCPLHCAAAAVMKQQPSTTALGEGNHLEGFTCARALARTLALFHTHRMSRSRLCLLGTSTLRLTLKQALTYLLHPQAVCRGRKLSAWGTR